jgi:hypothetical protein
LGGTSCQYLPSTLPLLTISHGYFLRLLELASGTPLPALRVRHFPLELWNPLFRNRPRLQAKDRVSAPTLLAGAGMRDTFVC